MDIVPPPGMLGLIQGLWTNNNHENKDFWAI
jgi:hypothetical protein